MRLVSALNSDQNDSPLDEDMHGSAGGIDLVGGGGRHDTLRVGGGDEGATYARILTAVSCLEGFHLRAQLTKDTPLGGYSNDMVS